MESHAEIICFELSCPMMARLKLKIPLTDSSRYVVLTWPVCWTSPVLVLVIVILILILIHILLILVSAMAAVVWGYRESASWPQPAVNPPYWAVHDTLNLAISNICFGRPWLIVDGPLSHKNSVMHWTQTVLLARFYLDFPFLAVRFWGFLCRYRFVLGHRNLLMYVCIMYTPLMQPSLKSMQPF